MSRALLVAVAALAPSTSLACSCLFPTVATAWNYGGDFVEVEIVAMRTRGPNRYYATRVETVYQGCASMGEEVILRTPVSGAACGGGLLAAGEHRLIETYDSGATHWGRRILDFSLCGVNQTVDTITRSDQAFLDSRLVTCPDTGTEVCTDGTMPHSCLVDPCDGAPDCRDGTCTASYCGGCNYEYFDDTGYEVCEDL